MDQKGLQGEIDNILGPRKGVWVDFYSVSVNFLCKQRTTVLGISKAPMVPSVTKQMATIPEDITP